MAISKRHKMPQQPILLCRVFEVWGIDLMEPFPVSNGYSYILLSVDYAIATKTNDAKVVVDFLKSNIFCQFGVSKALISDQGIGRTEADSLRMLYGHTELCTRLCWGCLPTRLSSVKAFHLLLSNAIWPTTKPTTKESSSCKNWRNFTWKHMRTPESTRKRSKKFHDQQILRKEF
ncbi:hypothetical protein CR513_52064, partial [Mucuna pruriens]